jgi:Cu-Zn family superoxide dismutase
VVGIAASSRTTMVAASRRRSRATARELHGTATIHHPTRSKGGPMHTPSLVAAVIASAIVSPAWAATPTPAAAPGAPAIAETPAAGVPDGDPDSATATLLDAQGKRVGLATLEGTPNGIVIVTDFDGLPPGPHAYHIHAVGTCTAPNFESAGGHFNPTGKSHGFAIGTGYHAGDLPNVYVPENGKLKIATLAPNARLRPGPNSILDADGAALVVHAAPDDYRSDPAGNAGKRIACGVITR